MNDYSLMNLLESSYELYPDKDYLYDGEASYTYKQLHQEAYWLAAGLSKLGVGKGDRVLACLPNWHEFVVLFFGLAKIGAVIIPCNPNYHRQDLFPILEDGEIKAVFVPENQDQIDLFHSIKTIVVTVRFEQQGSLSFSDVLSIGMNEEEPAYVQIDSEKDCMATLYSSGTTGKPKGVMLTHRNLLYAATVAKNALRCTEEDVVFTPVPVFHVFGLVPGVILTVLTGAKIIFMERFKTHKALQLMEKGRATIHLGVPTMFILELNRLSEQKYDLSSLRTGIIAGSTCSSQVIKMIRQEMGCQILISYGLTETSSAITFTRFTDNEKAGTETVGKSVPGSEIKIVDESHQEVPIGEIGELACRGIGVMKGYYNMPQKTKEVMDSDGWYYTGDLAKVNVEGYYTIVGRKKDMITRGGFKIYPSEVEEILYQHPSILDVAIIGLPDPVLGEISCAVIKLKSNCYVSKEDIISFTSKRVVKYKVPDRIKFIDCFPLTSSGKIKKNELKDMFIEEKKVLV